MKKTCLLTLVVMLFATHYVLFAQEKQNIKYGKIDAAAFTLPDLPCLQGADAVYLSDIGSSEFIGNAKGSLSLAFKRHVRIKIVTSNGFDAADFQIPIYSSGNDAEKLVQLKGITYNLENGKIIETQLKNDQVFVDKQGKEFWIKKFTMPGVKVGSIIDIQYTIDSDFFRYLRGWAFQGEYPRIWSEYNVAIPEIYDYVTLSQGYRNFDINTSSESKTTYNISGISIGGIGKYESRVFSQRWVMKQVPALKEEPFTTTLKNHQSKIEFQLSRFRPSLGVVEDVMSSYPVIVDKLNKNEYFGAALYKNNNWLDDELKTIVGNTTDTLEKANKIYQYLRDNYTCTDHSSMYLTEAGLKNILKSKKGSVADLNLLLVAMLRHEKIEAYPVVLSTRSHGYSSEIYPIMNRFNYTIGITIIGNREYFLDASDPMLGFGKLNAYCYNGHARVIAGDGIPVYLVADTLKEKKTTTFFAAVNEKGQWEGSINSSLGYYESLQIRETLKEKGKEEVVSKMKSSIGEIPIGDPEFDLVDKKEMPMKIKYELDLKLDGEEVVYFNPMIGEGYKENPFKSAERYYPVEMPYATDETYIANIDIPDGYKVDEVPKSARVKLNDDDGMFEYLVSVQGTKVLLRSSLIINKANFPAEDYQTLRDFFGYVVKKHGEQIVFKKVN